MARRVTDFQTIRSEGGLLPSDVLRRVLDPRAKLEGILEASQPGDGHLSFGAKSRQLANMAIGLSEVFVLQSAASNLLQMRDRIERGLAYAASALFSVFSGATGNAGDLPPYLVAAAAMESRAFPAFMFDPSAGTDWASRFDLGTNPQTERDWPLHDFTLRMRTAAERRNHEFTVRR